MAETADEREVLEANAAFYAAFESLDPDAMAAVWATEEPVRCVHPGWPMIAGRESVLESWSRIFDNAAAMQFTIIDAEARVEGAWA